MFISSVLRIYPECLAHPRYREAIPKEVSRELIEYSAEYAIGILTAKGLSGQLLSRTEDGLVEVASENGAAGSIMVANLRDGSVRVSAYLPFEAHPSFVRNIDSGSPDEVDVEIVSALGYLHSAK